MHQTNIKLNEIKENLCGELSETIYYKCNFCEKNVNLTIEQKKKLIKLTNNKFYCTYCLQNYLFTKNNFHILPISFRGIFSHYYDLYLSKPKRLYYSQIEDYIEKHKNIGLLNPLIRYDEETYLFFVDFYRIGKGKKKLPLQSVKDTIMNILNSLDLRKNLSVSELDVYSNFAEAIDKFYANRYRPENRKILAPTLSRIIGKEGNRNFTKTNFLMK